VAELFLAQTDDVIKDALLLLSTSVGVMFV